MSIDHLVEQKIREAQTLKDLIFILENLLKYNSVWKDGTLLSIRQLVEYVHGLKIEIYHNEHTPPHFHVSTSNFNVSFTIESCELLSGSIGGRERRMIEWWHTRSREKLIKIWNETRPTDCKVGPIRS